MKRSRLQYFSSRTFRSFVFSYIGMLILSLSLLSIVAIWHMAENVKIEEKRITENKLYTIAEDMEVQMSVFREMVLDVALKEEVRLDYFSVDKYKEIEMLGQLRNYRLSSDVCEYYFIKYTRQDNIFTSNGSVMPLSVYIGDRFGREVSEELSQLIERSAKEAEDKIYFYTRGDKRMLLYPLKKYATSKVGKEGVICFQLSESGLEERIETLVGKMDGRFVMYYMDFCFPEEDAGPGGEAAQAEGVVEMESLTGNVRVLYYPDADSYFSLGNIFSARVILIYAGLAALLFVLVFFIAYWNFTPMRLFTEKYSSKLEGDLTADWESIDASFENLLLGREKNSRLIQEQYLILREQTIRLIAVGGYSEKMQEYGTMLNIRLDAPVYGVIRCSFTGEREYAAEREGLLRDVEDLSGDGVCLYPYWGSEGELNVLTAMEEEYQMEEILELLQSLFEAKELRAVTTAMSVSHELKELNAGAGESDKVSENQMPEKQKSTAGQAVEYIRENCTRNDLSLDFIAREFQISSAYLCRIIKQETGMSYKEFLTELRINRAKQLLAEKNTSVLDVCTQTGYINVSHFIQVFQKYTGTTPAKYRDRQE